MSSLLNAQLSSGLTFPVQWEAMQDVSSQWMCQLGSSHTLAGGLYTSFHFPFS